jgi:hypothetical protein
MDGRARETDTLTGRNMPKTDHLLAIASPRSRALKNAKYEEYCRLRASLQPRIQAYREAGWETSDDDAAYSNACRLERRHGVRARIEYLSHQAEELNCREAPADRGGSVVNARGRYR